MSTIRCVLVDDHTLVRQAVATFLSADPEVDVVGQAGTVTEARHLLAATDTDVVLLDVSLPDGNGIALAAELRATQAGLGIVVLTMHDDDTTLLAAHAAGASALVPKTATSEEVLEAVRHAREHPERMRAAGLAAALRRATVPPRLTTREREVLQLLADGLSVSAVAGRLYLSESTVKTHIAKMYDKLGVHNRAGAVMAAINEGLVRPSGASPDAP